MASDGRPRRRFRSTEARRGRRPRVPARPLAALAAGLLAAGGALAVAPPRPDGPGDAGLPPIVFVSRHPVHDADGGLAPGAIPGIGPRDRAAAVGGRLLVREPDGRLRVLVEPPTLFDCSDPCVSWDGRRVAFAGLEHPDSSWRIYEIGADGGGLRQVTRSDRTVSLAQFGAAAARFARYDDLDPAWLPDGRICFASTRYPMLTERGDHLATNLFVVGAEGGPPRRITTERSGGEEPVVDPLTGRVVYSRWWINLDRPSNVTRDGITYRDDEALTRDIGDFWQTISITPDGRGARLHAGDPRSRAGLACYKAAPLADGRTLGLTGANPSFTPSPGGTGIQGFGPGIGPGRPVIGLDPDPVPGDTAAAPAAPPPPWACDPVALPDGRLVVSYLAPGASDFALYTCRPDGSGLAPLVDLPGVHELDAGVLAPAPRPPVIADLVDPDTAELPPTEDPASHLSGGTFRFDCLNVFANAPVDAPIPDAPNIARDTRIRFFLNFQRQSPRGRDPSILHREAPLTPRGAVAEQGIPAEVPLFGQLVDSRGRLLASPDGTPAHVAGFAYGRHGGWAQCVGCHAGHSVMEIPRNFTSAEWFNASTSARVEASSEWIPPGDGRPPAPARRVVDRRTRGVDLDVAWVADGRRGEFVVLRWEIPIEISRFVLYGVRADPQGRTDLRVDDCRITLLHGGREVARVPRTGPVLADGTEVPVPRTIADAVKIELRATRGGVRGLPLAGLAEVETIARLTLE